MMDVRSRAIDVVRHSRLVIAIIGIAVLASAARADQGGISSYLPGSFGSLAATPQEPGWSYATIYYHSSVSGGGDVSASRQATIGNLNRSLNINLNANTKASVDLQFLGLSYVFKQPVLGGQLALSMLGAYGYSSASVDGTLTTSLGNQAVTRSGRIDDARWGAADLFPQATLRWNSGVNNYMVYAMGNVPIGSYDSNRLVNFGLGYPFVDAGVGYTYFNPQAGYEFSAVTGLTYNFEDTHTDYQNGIDWHLEWAASKFITKQVHVGTVGYYYQQLTADSGQPAILGDFKSRVVAVGPQIGFLFPVGDMQGYLNLKAYFEFAAQNRPEGFNTWLSFALSPASEPPSTQARRAHR